MRELLSHLQSLLGDLPYAQPGPGGALTVEAALLVARLAAALAQHGCARPLSVLLASFMLAGAA